MSNFWNTLSLTANIGTDVFRNTGTEVDHTAINSGSLLPISSAGMPQPWPSLFYLKNNAHGLDNGLYSYANGNWTLQFKTGSAPDIYLGNTFPTGLAEGTYFVLGSHYIGNPPPNPLAGVYRFENGEWNILQTYGADGLSYISTPLPTTEMTGGAAGASPTSLLSDASAIYSTQVIDASKRPAGFSLAPSALSTSEFLSWNSTFQRDYILEKGFTISGSSDKQAVTVGPAGSQATVFLSTSENTLEGNIRGQKLYVVENLQKTDVGLMSLADQKRLAVLDAWSNATTGVGTRLGFTPTGTVTTASIVATREALKSLLEGYKAKMGEVWLGISLTNARVFQKQIDNLKSRLDNMAVFNEQAIKDAADAIKERYQRAAAFGYQSTDKTDTAYQIDRQLQNDVTSTDGNKTIKDGYDKFMATEMRIANLDSARIKMSNGLPHLARVDLPRLIFMMQVNYQLTNKQISEGNQEELRQQNAYLKDVSIFQADIQTTLSFFGTKSDETKAFLGYESPNDHVDTAPGDTKNPFTGTRVKAFSMFEGTLTHTDGQHPIQKYRDLPDRPTATMLSSFQWTPQGGTTGTYGNFDKHIKTYWDAIVTKVNDHVTLVQQQGTAVQNTITNKDKEANRNFDLATNVLTKMYETMSMIIRSS